MSQKQVPASKINEAQNYRREIQEHKQKVMPLLKFLKKNGLKFKHASCMGSRIQYFRMDMLSQILQKKKQQIKRDTKLSNLIQNIKQQIVFLKRPQNSQKLRFPQVLVPTKVMTGKFATFKFDTTQSKRIYVFIVLIVIAAAVLFPLWPYELKYSLWILSVVLLVTIVSIILLRLVLYTIMATFGISFWLFPNLFGDYAILDSFKPVFSVTKWQNDIFSIILRVLSFVLFIYYCHSIYTQPEFYLDNFTSAKDIVKDVHDWGVGKIKGDIGNFSQRALTMDKIINQTADAFQQQQKNQYTNFEQPSQKQQNIQKTQTNEENQQKVIKQEQDLKQNEQNSQL